MRVDIRELSKRYRGGITALQDVDLTVENGLYGLLGPNGAGKTTLMKITCTLLEPSSGQVLVDGRDVADDRNLVRERLGYLPQEWGAPRAARCWEVVDLMLRLRGVRGSRERKAETDRVLGAVGLSELRKRKVKTLSGGQLRRLGVAQALAGSPDLLVLDEPTVGLDPDERVRFRNLLSDLGRERCIILSTHIVADVGTTCDRVAVLEGGRVAYEGAPEGFAAKAEGRVFEVSVPLADESLYRERLGEAATVVSSAPGVDDVTFRLVGEPLADGPPARPVEPTLEDAYLLVVGAAALDGEEVAA